MLITLSIANNYKIANHLTDPDATYISSLKINSVSTKKGIATDTYKFTMERDVVDHLDQSFLYLCYDTPADLYIDNILIFKGYINKIDTSAKSIVSLNVTSIMNWQLQQFAAPQIDSLCQNQVYSENCTLIKEDFSYVFTTVDINCFTGEVTLDTLGGYATLGGNTGTGNDLFLDTSMWWNAFVIINGIYKTTVVNVIDGKIFLGLNYMDMNITTTSLVVYLKCDKTYGECYSRFNNTRNFWGFANTGRKISTIDIFSASDLEYCGQELANQDFEYCSTDVSIFGILLTSNSEDNNG